MKKSNLIENDSVDENDLNKLNENNLYQEKMKNINEQKQK